MKSILVPAAALLSMLAVDLAAHSGGTNAAGCHTNRRTGDYHCHARKSPRAGSPTWCHVVPGERRCGYARSTCRDLARRYGGYCTVN